jgi:hypothetical protein
MKRRLCLLLVAFVLFLSPTAFSQENPRIGLGVSIADFSEVLLLAASGPNSTPSSLMPTIFVPINVSSRYRVEPEIGFQHVSSRTSGQSSSNDASDTSVHVGAGVFGLTTPKDHFTIYYGIRLAYLRFSQSTGSPNGTNGYSFPTANGYFVTPTVGGEYFLGDHLSLGGEVQFRYTHETLNAASDTRTITLSAANTHGAITLRFWFR